jgi:hypothetical protein
MFTYSAVYRAQDDDGAEDTGTVAVTSAVVAPGALGVVKLINRPGTSS